jgi:hypothetical protein
MSEENTQTATTPDKGEKTYTEADIQALLNAKNYEKQGRQAAEAKVKELEASMLKLQSEKYGDEDKIVGSPLYKKLLKDFEDSSAKLKQTEEALGSLQQEKLYAELKQELKNDKTLLEDAAEDALLQAKLKGFTKVDGKWLSKDGETVANFMAGLKQTKAHYFKNATGASSAYKEKLEKNKGLSAKEKLHNLLN